MVGLESEVKTMTYERISIDAIEACRQIAWKLGHNSEDGPVKTDRLDIVIKMAMAVAANADVAQVPISIQRSVECSLVTAVEPFDESIHP